MVRAVGSDTHDNKVTGIVTNMSMNHRPIIHVLAMSLILGPLACEEANLALPSESEAEAHYASSSDVTVRVSGNVVELTVDQPLRQVRRGGSLWVKVGPYIYLFSDETETLLRDYPGLSGVRVITRTGRNNAEVARAFLHRDSLNELTWETGEKHRREGAHGGDAASGAVGGARGVGSGSHRVRVQPGVRHLVRVLSSLL